MAPKFILPLSLPPFLSLPFRVGQPPNRPRVSEAYRRDGLRITARSFGFSAVAATIPPQIAQLPKKCRSVEDGADAAEIGGARIPSRRLLQESNL